MKKSLLLVSTLLSFTYAGITDDIKKDQNQQQQIDAMVLYQNSIIKECNRMRFNEREHAYHSPYSLQQLDELYASAPNVNEAIKHLNQEHKEKISQFLKPYRNSQNLHPLLEQLNITPYYSRDGDKALENICEVISDVDEYKEQLKTAYLQEENRLKEEANEKQSGDLKKAKIEQLKIILDTELFHSWEREKYSLQEYENFMASAESIWKKINEIKDDDDFLIIHNVMYEYRNITDYVNDLKKWRDIQVKTQKNVKEKNSLIPEYKKWKSSFSTFQNTLKPGTEVYGGIVIRTDGDLVVINTAKGYVNQRRDKTIPRVPSKLWPLFVDELYGLKVY